MGQSRRNVEAVTDYADGRHFIRLHRDVLLPAAVCEAVRRHLAAGRWDAAKALTLEHAPADSHPEVELFLTPAADRPAGEAWACGEPACEAGRPALAVGVADAV